MKGFYPIQAQELVKRTFNTSTKETQAKQNTLHRHSLRYDSIAHTWTLRVAQYKVYDADAGSQLTFQKDWDLRRRLLGLFA